jgi:hypothetical protein
MKASGQKSAAYYHCLALQTKLEDREDVGEGTKLCTCDSGIGYVRICVQDSLLVGHYMNQPTLKLGLKKRCQVRILIESMDAEKVPFRQKRRLFGLKW